MKEVDKEKYFGDIVDKTGSIDATINSKKFNGQGIITRIMSILTKIPLGRHTIGTAMKLRNVMVINGIFYNSEAWHGVTQKNIKTL